MKYKISTIAIASMVYFSGISAAWAETAEPSSNERTNTVKPRGIQAFTGTKPTGINEIPGLSIAAR